MVSGINGALPKGCADRQLVFRWEHETDRRSWFANGLEQYLELRLKNVEDDLET